MSVTDPTLTASAAEEVRERRDILRQIFRSGTFLVGLGIVLFWLFCAVFGPTIVPYDPYADRALVRHRSAGA